MRGFRGREAKTRRPEVSRDPGGAQKKAGFRLEGGASVGGGVLFGVGRESLGAGVVAFRPGHRDEERNRGHEGGEGA